MSPAALGDGEPRFERPIGNLSRGRVRGSQRTQPLVFQRVGHDGLQDSAGSAQRQVILLLLQGAAAIGVGLFDNGAEFDVVNEIEPVRRLAPARMRK